MSPIEQQPVLKMEIGDNYVCAQHLVGVGEVNIYHIEVGTSRGLMATITEQFGKCFHWRSVEVINDSIGISYFILDVEVEMFQIC
jgi:hypothetical protein